MLFVKKDIKKLLSVMIPILVAQVSTAGVTFINTTMAGHAGAGFDRVGVEDRFGQSGKPDALFVEYGLTAENIAAKVKALL